MNEELQDFLSEIETMKHIGHHKNIINMLGTCSVNGKFIEKSLHLRKKTLPCDTQQFCIVRGCA